MQPTVTLPTSRSKRRLSRWLTLLAILAGLALTAAACGGGSSGSSDTLSGQGAGGGSQSQSAAGSALKYAQCMRSHGDPDFSDPGANGGSQQGGPVNLSSPQFEAANKTCSHLVNGGKGIAPVPSQQSQSQLLKYAECMRSHGVTNFPDPNSGGGFTLGSAPAGGSGASGGIDPSSPQFQSASQACQSLQQGVPGGGS